MTYRKVLFFVILLLTISGSSSFAKELHHPKDSPKFSLTVPDTWTVTYDEDDNLITESPDKNLVFMFAKVGELEPYPVNDVAMLVSKSMGFWQSSGNLVEGQINIFSPNPEELFSDLFAMTVFVNPKVFKKSYEQIYLDTFFSLRTYGTSASLTRKEAPKNTPVPEPTSPPARQQKQSSPSQQAEWVDFKEIRDVYQENKETMTKLNFKSWWKEAKERAIGTRVMTEGYVDDVKETWTGKLIIRVDIDNPETTIGSVYDIELLMNPEKDKELVAKFSKGDPIRFTGTVTSFDFVLGSLSMEMEDVEIR